ncbi:hypothetical protein CEP52_003073 [Fusarium oligoseptatum]|uniref:Uncharacterized protein n=1 Tax=Fusarium oligoseptatum TaxID=2604345 RepID=A0A428UB26_9HYPO|nr:hypothetical protein CEP52_003073 [Fusarium oligoseptatum]
MSMLGKTFVVTGGASGIGLAIVRKLVQMSASVHVIDWSDTFQDLDAEEGKVWFYPSVDVSKREDVTKAFNSIAERTPKLHGLVNCAGIVRQHPTTVENDAIFKQVLDVNLGGTWNVTTEFMRVVNAEDATAKKPDTSIVNIGSTSSYRGFPFIPGYVASKHAVLGLTRAWAQEFGPLGIRVNMIGPGVVATPMTKVEGGSAKVDALTGIPVALDRLAEPEEIADVAHYLLGSSASYVNGQGIEVNGGWLG